MLSPVSFGSTYKMSISSNAKNIANYYATQEFCDSQGIPCIDNFEGQYCTMISPDSRDNYLETYMKNKGIEFVKLDSKKLMDPRMINLRVMKAPKGMHKVEINVDRFEALLKKSDGNYEHCKSDYDKYYKEKLETQIKSGEPISAASVYLVAKTPGLSNYIKSFGIENVDKCMLDTVFQMTNYTEDSSMYFAMKDAGMKKVPVYMDKDSFELAYQMGIVAV